MEMPLTKEEIERDIAAYQDRLSRAEAKLKDLPNKGKTWKERSKVRATRRVLLAEIRHVRTLINYAEAALTEVVD